MLPVSAKSNRDNVYCLYSEYYADFASFKTAISESLSKTDTEHKSTLDSLLTLKFQTFEKAQIVPV